MFPHKWVREGRTVGEPWASLVDCWGVWGGELRETPAQNAGALTWGEPRLCQPPGGSGERRGHRSLCSRLLGL